MKKEIKKIIKKYNLQKINDNYIFYDYELTLNNLKTKWFIKFRDKMFFSRFENIEMLEKINEKIPCNTQSGKCNQFIFNFESIDNFINYVLFVNKHYKKAV